MPSLRLQIKSDTGIRQVLTADFNNDGNPDLVFLQHFRITVVLGNGFARQPTCGARTFACRVHTRVNAGIQDQSA